MTPGSETQSRVLVQLLALFKSTGIDWLRLPSVLKLTDGSFFTDENISRLINACREDHGKDINTEDFILWLIEGNPKSSKIKQTAKETIETEVLNPVGRGTHRHLVLHFDINKTIVMMDSVTGKSLHDIANHVMALSCWGCVETSPGTEVGITWRCKVAAPSVRRPSPELVSYAEFLEQQYPGQVNKERRESCWHKFTQSGEPGAGMRKHLESFIAALQLPADVVGTDDAKNAGLVTDEVFIVPAFFELMLYLKRTNRSFCVVFRTFGKDLVEVATEFNAFCEGRHPLFPGASFDGRDGCADYRVDFEDPTAFGTFFRSGNDSVGDILVYGTLEQPRLQDGIDFYDDKEKFPNVRIVRGSPYTLHQDLRTLTRKRRTLALRDFFPYWRSQGMGADPAKLNGGKLLVIDPRPSNTCHDIFFDDNIVPTASRIVDVRHARLIHKVLSVDYLFPCHIVRAEPLEIVTDPQYFVRHVERLTLAYERRLEVMSRLRSLLQTAARQNMFTQAKDIPWTESAQNYDAWGDIKEERRSGSKAAPFPEFGSVAPSDFVGRLRPG